MHRDSRAARLRGLLNCPTLLACLAERESRSETTREGLLCNLTSSRNIDHEGNEPTV